MAHAAQLTRAALLLAACAWAAVAAAEEEASGAIRVCGVEPVGEERAAQLLGEGTRSADELLLFNHFSPLCIPPPPPHI